MSSELDHHDSTANGALADDNSNDPSHSEVSSLKSSSVMESEPNPPPENEERVSDNGAATVEAENHEEEGASAIPETSEEAGAVAPGKEIVETPAETQDVEMTEPQGKSSPSEVKEDEAEVPAEKEAEENEKDKEVVEGSEVMEADVEEEVGSPSVKDGGGASAVGEKGFDDPLATLASDKDRETDEDKGPGAPVIRVSSSLMSEAEGEGKSGEGASTSTETLKAVGDESTKEASDATEEEGDGTSKKEVKKGHSAPDMYTCAWDLKHITPRTPSAVTWEALEFCSVDCMESYQKEYVSSCSHCMSKVYPPALGKYCVRFGADIHQFCSSTCLDQFKKGLKICAFCQRDINQSSESFVAPVGDKGTVFKDFCTQLCMDRYESINLGKKKPPKQSPCQVCNTEAVVFAEVVVDEGKTAGVCSDPCLQAYKFANKFDLSVCGVCKRQLVKTSSTKEHVNHSGKCDTFCSQVCANVFIINSRRIVPCSRCKVKKYTYDMLENSSGSFYCSCECLRQAEITANSLAAQVNSSSAPAAPSAVAVPGAAASPGPGRPRKKDVVQCHFCHRIKTHEFTVVQGTNKQFYFCSSSCATRFKNGSRRGGTIHSASKFPRVTAAQEAAASLVPQSYSSVSSGVASSSVGTTSVPPSIAFFTPSQTKTLKSKGVQAKWLTASRSSNTSDEPKQVTKCTSTSTQTDPIKPVFFPVPIPLYVPTPLAMFKTPTPHPLPIPVPVPVPIFLPMKKSDAEGILDELKQIEENIPDDPREYDLLALAAAAAGGDEEGGPGGGGGGDDADADDATAFLEEAMQDAQAVAQDAEIAGQLEELEGAVMQHSLKPNPANQPRRQTSPTPVNQWETADRRRAATPNRKRGRQTSTRGGYSPVVDPAAAAAAAVRNARGQKRPKLEDDATTSPQASAPQPVKREMKKPFPEDPNFKYQLGMFAWDKWAAQRNARMVTEYRPPGIKTPQFVRDIVSMTPDELVWALCTFVDEVRKADGSRYQPDVLFYLLIGIQFYFKEIGGRSENFITSPFATPFQQKLSEYLKAFDPERMMMERGCIVTRVEEAHLWGARLIGAHSPHVLLFTMMYITTKYFLLKTPKEHRSLAFPHIMKIWKRPEAGSNQTTRQTILRYAPPPAVKAEQGYRGNLVRELNENLVDRYKCPVKLLEFYVSKIPEHCRHRTNMFYLIPERSTTGESPVWYTSMPCEEDFIDLCLRRVMVVREVQQALIDASG